MRALKAVSPSGSRRKPDRPGLSVGSATAAMRAKRVSATSLIAGSGAIGARGGKEAQPVSQDRTSGRRRRRQRDFMVISSRGGRNASPPPNIGGVNPASPDTDTTLATLPNGARVVAIRLPHLGSASVSVFVRAGSQHESARLNGISHFIEHMAFKGTRSRDCQRINLDAERLGAEVNAYTDKDHTAFEMGGPARDAAAFVGMLGDIVRESTFPEAELTRERDVLLHEYAEDEDDAMATAFKRFDEACYGAHAAARPVIGSRTNLRRFTRSDLVAWVQQRYTAANTVVAVA